MKNGEKKTGNATGKYKKYNITTLDGMRADQFDLMMERGYNQAVRGEGEEANTVFARLRKSLGK